MQRLEAEFPEKLAFLFEPARYKVAHGGRGSAKSWGFARALLIPGWMEYDELAWLADQARTAAGTSAAPSAASMLAAKSRCSWSRSNFTSSPGAGPAAARR